MKIQKYKQQIAEANKKTAEANQKTAEANQKITVLRLRLKGLSEEDIAGQLQIPLGTVHTILSI